MARSEVISLDAFEANDLLLNLLAHDQAVPSGLLHGAIANHPC